MQPVLTKPQTPASKMPMPASLPTMPSSTGRPRAPSVNGNARSADQSVELAEPGTTVQVYPIFNVAVPQQAAPQVHNVVNVEPTPVTVENRVVPATVHVGGVAQPPAQITAEDGPAEFTFQRDGKGNIVSAKRKPI